MLLPSGSDIGLEWSCRGNCIWYRNYMYVLPRVGIEFFSMANGKVR